MKKIHHAFISMIGIFLLVFLTAVPGIRAQGYPPGFNVNFEWEHFEEQSKDQREMDTSHMGARIIYSFPQTFDLFVGLSWQDMDVRINGTDIDLDSALAFRIGGKAYLVRAIPLGVPADFVIGVSYSTAKHEESTTKADYTHRRIIGTGGMEWRYMSTVPYLNFGVLYSELDTPPASPGNGESLDQTSFYISAGISAPILDTVNLRAEVNIAQEIGYALGVQFRF